jgi:hypothetical protein
MESTQPSMEWAQAVALLAEIATREDACCLQMGDHLNVIETQFKGRNRMKLAAAEAGVTWALARQRSWVAKRVPPGSPLRDTQLTYCHLRAVAGTKDPLKWGMLALANNWSVAQIKEEIDKAGDKEAQQSGEPCVFCEAAMTEEMEIISFRMGSERTRRVCSPICAIGFFRRVADGGTTPLDLIDSAETFSL